MIGIFLGEQNSGKTLSMTYFTKLYYNMGYTIYSNYNLNFPHEVLTKDLIEEYTKSRKQFEKSIFCIDEIYLFFDSRSSANKANKIFSYFLVQSSKNNVHIFGTAQFFNMVEKRFRNNTYFKCFCSRVYKKKGEYYNIESGIRFLKNTENLYIKNNFVVKKIMGIYEGYRSKVFYLKAKEIFNLYDTRELINLT